VPTDNWLNFGSIGRFEKVRILGSGAMGVVYEVRDPDRGEALALKTLVALGSDALLGFKQEFRALQDLHHPNLVRLGELFEEKGVWFFTMELVEGEDFIRHVRPKSASEPAPQFPATPPDEPTQRTARAEIDGRSVSPAPAEGAQFDERRLRSALGQVARGLCAIHRAHKVHCDVKPSNILVTPQGRVVILDFGLVTDLVEPQEEREVIAGTTSYLAPELTGYEPISAPVDWYALGVMLYLALTGRLPYVGTAIEVLRAKHEVDPIAPAALIEGVPRDLNDLCMALLQRDPRDRPTGEEVLGLLGLPTEATRELSFVGRSAELRALIAAQEATQSQAVTLFVHGASGLGKSALVRAFTQRISNSPRAPLVLFGRCYERETVPFKAVDGVIDSLTRHLRLNPGLVTAQLLPPRAELIRLVFPVLRRVPAFAEDNPLEREVLDPHELRRQLFEAVRQLFANLSNQVPLVLAVDDLHWADVDSLALLSELTRPPGAPRLLLLCTTRAPLTPDAADRARQFDGDVRRLVLEGLPPSDARALAEQLLSQDGVALTYADAIASEASGHPLFIDELVRRSRTLGDKRGSVVLQDALRLRVEALDATARKLLELVSVAGSPLTQQALSAANGLTFATAGAQIALLRSEKLVRTSGSRRTDVIEPYHDRIRETVLTLLTPDRRRQLHAELASALEAEGDTDPEELATHFRGMGETEKAFTLVLVAARRALSALAFDRAARLFQAALEAEVSSADQALDLRVRMADALVNAGQGEAAAKAYALAAAQVGGTRGLELERKATEQLLATGLFDEGEAALEKVLGKLGFSLPKTPKGAFASLVWRRLGLSVSARTFRERRSQEVGEEELCRLDTLWVAAQMLSVSDLVRGAEFQLHHLSRALRAGEPMRISRGLTLVAILAATEGPRSAQLAHRLLEEGREIAERLQNPHLIGTGEISRGISVFLLGDYPKARLLCRQGVDTLRKHCTGVGFEVMSGEHYLANAEYFMGEFKALAQRVPALIREADERGDVYARASLRLGSFSVSWLLNDDVGRAREEAALGMRLWSKKGFHLQHFFEMLGHLDIDLYANEPASAHERLVRTLPLLEKSLLLRVQTIRINTTYMRAKAELAMLIRAGKKSPTQLRPVEKLAKAIARERMPWGNGLAALIQGLVEAHRGNAEAAAVQLEAAIALFGATHMRLHQATARLRLGKVIGGDRGAELVALGRAAMLEQRVIKIEKMAQMLGPAAG
jgi:serine/threonine protein kinase